MSFLGGYLAEMFKPPAIDQEITGIRYAQVDDANQVSMQDTGTTELTLGEPAAKGRSILLLKDAAQQEKFVCTSRTGKSDTYKAGPGKTFIIVNATYVVAEKKKESTGGVAAPSTPMPTELPIGGPGEEEDTFSVETSSLLFKLVEQNAEYNITVYPDCPDTFPLEAIAKHGTSVSGNLIFKVSQNPAQLNVKYSFDENIVAVWALEEGS
ncbi:MAG: hypothetical protein GOV15_01340 [Candidatus Diapherotrites archaeon]|nr:hypothetical protein [Candidatus Diapherotrites archaeon]